jgi:hypothetical protein
VSETLAVPYQPQFDQVWIDLIAESANKAAERSADIDIHTTEDYQQHRTDVVQWITAVGEDDLVNDTEVATLAVFAGRYGTATVDPTNKEQSQANQPVVPAVALQTDHMVALLQSPKLYLYQKVDLMAISAYGLQNATAPVNGVYIAQRTVRAAQRQYAKYGKRHPEHITAATQWERHLGLVAQELQLAAPRVGALAMFKRMASAEMGREVTNVPLALAVMVGKSRAPFISAEQRAKNAARDQGRKERAVAKAEQDRARAGARFAHAQMALIRAQAQLDDTQA